MWLISRVCVICDHDHFYVKYGDQNDRVDHTHTQGYIVFFLLNGAKPVLGWGKSASSNLGKPMSETFKSKLYR